jgi:hypothetical protein
MLLKKMQGQILKNENELQTNKESTVPLCGGLYAPVHVVSTPRYAKYNKSNS